MKKTERIKNILYLLFPRFWNRRYSKQTIGNTIYGGNYIVWWNYRINLGDYLSTIVAKHMLSLKSIDINNNKNNKKKKHLFVIGSILGFGSFDATIWGTGCLNLLQAANIVKQSSFRNYEVCAVRGPLTKRVLESAGYIVPDIFGDPAIIMPDIYYPKEIAKKYDVSVVFHFRYFKKLNNRKIHNISIETDDYKHFIDEIVSSKLIISSSLHGIILAESYGVPAIFLCENIKDEDLFKYYDWYYSTGRYDVRIAKSLDEALTMQPMDLPTELLKMKKRLISSFPYHLWGHNYEQ